MQVPDAEENGLMNKETMLNLDSIEVPDPTIVADAFDEGNDDLTQALQNEENDEVEDTQETLPSIMDALGAGSEITDKS